MNFCLLTEKQSLIMSKNKRETLAATRHYMYITHIVYYTVWLKKGTLHFPE